MSEVPEQQLEAEDELESTDDVFDGEPDDVERAVDGKQDDLED